MPFWQQVAVTTIPVVLPFVVALAVVVAKALFERLPANQREEAARIVQALVAGAEQAMPGATGADKKEAVVQDLEAIFKASHLNVPPQLVNALIESAVLQLNDGNPPVSASAPVGFKPSAVPLVSPDAPAARVL